MKKLNIENINSKEIVNFYIDEQSVISKLDYLVHKAFEIPVYLVDEDLMDFLYPPYKRRLLSEENAKELLASLNERIDERRDFEKDTQMVKEIMSRFYERSYEEGSNQSTPITAVGLYIHSLNQNLSINFKKFQELLDKIKSPCIIISPERVVKWAQGTNISVKNVFELVYFHELAHAYIHYNLRDYQKPWYRIVEESYCNAVAFERFRLEKDIYEINLAINRQPTEYRGYTFFANNFFMPFSLDYFDIDEIRYLLYRFHFRRGIWHPYNVRALDAKFFKRLWKLRIIKEDFFVWLAISILEEVLD